MDSQPTNEELVARYKQGDHDAFAQLVKNGSPLLDRIVNKFSRHALDAHRDDIYQSACMGMMDAAMSFDPARGCKFFTHATRRMIGAAQDWWRNSGSTIRVPRLLVAEARQDGRLTCDSLDAVVGYKDSGVPKLLQDTLPNLNTPDPLTEAMSGEQQEALDWGLQRLPERERTILQLRMAGATMQEIGKAVGLSESRISQCTPKLFSALTGIVQARLGEAKPNWRPLTLPEQDYLSVVRRLYSLQELAEDLKRHRRFILYHIRFLHGTVALTKVQKEHYARIKHKMKIQGLFPPSKKVQKRKEEKLRKIAS